MTKERGLEMSPVRHLMLGMCIPTYLARVPDPGWSNE